MAQASEPFSWRIWPYGRECAVCERTLRIQDVGEHRTVYENSKVIARYLWCKDHRGGRIT